jgi:cytochrome c oxidase accessory protein FixG
VFALTTYLLGGIAREQVCTYMCPWPRIQGAMFDADSLLVTYRSFRGEPRGPHKRGETWDGRGDCIDCKLCVAVCPAGIDIRDGAQLECIQCALCIDACNEVMAKLGRPKNLIAYDTFHNIEAEAKGLPSRLRLIRPRTVLYSGMIAIVSVVMLMALWGRTTLEVNVLRDRNPLFVQLSDGGVRNGYTLKILNKRQETRSFRISTDGLPGATLSIVGQEGVTTPEIVVPTDDLRALKIYVAVPAGDVKALPGEATDFAFVVTDTGDGTVSRNTTNFRRPAK